MGADLSAVKVGAQLRIDWWKAAGGSASGGGDAGHEEEMDMESSETVVGTVDNEGMEVLVAMVGDAAVVHPSEFCISQSSIELEDCIHLANIRYLRRSRA
jgi:hypothetical protein